MTSLPGKAGASGSDSGDRVASTKLEGAQSWRRGRPGFGPWVGGSGSSQQRPLRGRGRESRAGNWQDHLGRLGQGEGVWGEAGHLQRGPREERPVEATGQSEGRAPGHAGVRRGHSETRPWTLVRAEVAPWRPRGPSLASPPQPASPPLSVQAGRSLGSQLGRQSMFPPPRPPGTLGLKSRGHSPICSAWMRSLGGNHGHPHCPGAETEAGAGRREQRQQGGGGPSTQAACPPPMGTKDLGTA